MCPPSRVLTALSLSQLPASPERHCLSPGLAALPAILQLTHCLELLLFGSCHLLGSSNDLGHLDHTMSYLKLSSVSRTPCSLLCNGGSLYKGQAPTVTRSEKITGKGR